MAENKKKDATFWDKHKDKIYISLIALLALDLRRARKAYNMSVNTINLNTAIYDEALSTIHDTLNDHKKDIDLLKSIVS